MSNDLFSTPRKQGRIGLTRRREWRNGWEKQNDIKVKGYVGGQKEDEEQYKEKEKMENKHEDKDEDREN